MAHPETVSPGRLRLVPLTADLVPAVDAFHERLRLRGGPHYRLGTAIAPTASSESPSKSVWLETLFAFDGHDVRGGIMLQHRTLHSATGTKDVVNIQLPLSEGTIDRKFAHVGMWLIRTVLQSHPYAYAVGMGALDQPLPKLLSAMRWTVVPVPFFFHVNRPTRFVRKMPALNRTRGRRLLTTIAGLSGAAWLGVTLAQGVTAFSARRDTKQHECEERVAGVLLEVTSHQSDRCEKCNECRRNRRNSAPGQGRPRQRARHVVGNGNRCDRKAK